MHEVIALVLLLCFAVNGPIIRGQGAVEALEIKYNKDTNITSVTTRTQLLSGTPLNGLHLRIVGMYEGEKLNEIKSTGLLIFSVADKPIFEDDRNLTLIIDGKELKLGQMELGFHEYDTVRHMEGLYVRVSLETLAKLANAHKIEGKVGAKSFALTQAHQQAIKAFVGYFARAWRNKNKMVWSYASRQEAIKL